jgi:hypothetical protein
VLNNIFFWTSQNGIYINITKDKVVSSAQGVPRRTTTVLQRYQYEYKTLVDVQTKQWVRPPGMMISSKCYH